MTCTDWLSHSLSEILFLFHMNICRSWLLWHTRKHRLAAPPSSFLGQGQSMQSGKFIQSRNQMSCIHSKSIGSGCVSMKISQLNVHMPQMVSRTRTFHVRSIPSACLGPMHSRGHHMFRINTLFHNCRSIASHLGSFVGRPCACAEYCNPHKPAPLTDACSGQVCWL